MMRTFKYPLLPNAHQERVLDSWRMMCAQLYNACLEQRSLYIKWLSTLYDPKRLERDENWQEIPKRDDHGEIVWERDENDEIVVDYKGDPVFVPKHKPNPAAYFGQSAQLTTIRQEDRNNANKL